jgi:hypothetical protein
LQSRDQPIAALRFWPYSMLGAIKFRSCENGINKTASSRLVRPLEPLKKQCFPRLTP